MCKKENIKLFDDVLESFITAIEDDKYAINGMFKYYERLIGQLEDFRKNIEASEDD